MAMTPEAHAAKQVTKAINSVSFDPDMFAYSFTQGMVGADTEIQKRMFEVLVALTRVWAGWHVSGYAGNSSMAGICEQSNEMVKALGINNAWMNSKYMG